MRIAIFAFLLACGSKSAPPPTEPASPPPPGAGSSVAVECAPTGCSGSVCAKKGEDVMTTCEMKAEYACYSGAECKAQADGQCGWTMDDKLKSCLASPPPLK